jgi:hypothetical protein
VTADRLGQRRAGHVGRGQPRYLAIQVRVDDERGEQAAHLASRGDLAPEPGPELGITGKFLADNFDRDRPASR